MALAPADFAAYSRATGTPYPEDPEDRAALAPAVRDFRQSQLRQQESGSPVGALAGLAAVGLGALGLGLAARRGFGAKAAGGGRKGGITLADLSDPRNAAVLQVANQATKSEPPVKTTSTNLVNYRFQQNLADIPEPTQQELNKITKSQFDRAYNEITKLPLPRTTVDPNTGREVILDPFGVDPSSRQAVYASTAVKPQSQLRKVYKPQSGIPVELITDPNTGEIFRRGKSPSTFAQTYISPSVDLVNTEEPVEFLLNDPELKQLVAQQRRQEGAELGREAQRQMRVASAIETEADEYIAQLRQESLSQQTLGALESGEDQMTGRTMMGVQRNEDLDVSQVNAVARQTGSADVAASMTPDGIPVDQTDPWGQPTIPQIKKTQQGSTPLLPAAAASPREKAQEFLQSRFEELGGTIPGRYRRERAMGMDTEIAEAAELYAATGDPSVLSRFSTNAASPLAIKPAVQMSINDEELPTGQFFKPTGFSENTGDLLERDIELTNKISELGTEKLEIARKAKELGEQELMLRYAMETEPDAGGPYTQMFAKVKNQQQNLIDPETLNVDIGDAMAERDFIRNQTESLENLGSTYKLADIEEGVRPYYEYDQYGQPIAETLEIRGGRKAIDLEPKGGGGRRLAQFDPQGQTGSQVGLYGVEQATKAAGATTRPTQMTMNELVREGMEQASADPYGDVPIPPSLPQMTERKPTAQARRSLEVSQIMRQAMIEGRDPQMILRQRGFNV